ncbi:ankyrin repeat domain-containing protein [Microvirga tunisiensis]|uniref:Ankyrin repeat domain-containing protein n=1 Tax=Microvirga tunisiensis TaxID=2108360 RepID=A0A5N7MBJ1_9HYPH|nr:ankyrin repeat domain-containing protein [Microvirga tunisiensis]MPR06282.1 ankyrin repeat domain-containing protein [Microvirga tunisiensis]MPR24068.1 ankyrin repeat domain-containing protein [Microvirga tunisiensis]
MSVLQKAVESGCISEVERILVNGDPEELRHELPGALTFALDAGFSTISRRLANDPIFDPGEQACPNLSKAVSLGYVDVAQFLIAKGSKLNLIVGGSRSPLRIALENEYFDLARFMVAHGAEISVRDSNGWTALIWASITGNRATYDFLIEHGADIHICTNDGWNALAGAFFKRWCTYLYP